MGQESRQLKRHIDIRRDELGRDIDTLQSKVKQTFDWRTQFKEHPMTMIGVAFGAGVLLSTVGSRQSTRTSAGDGHYHNPGTASPNAQKALEVWDKIKGALVGVAAAKVQSFLGEVMPEFRSEYDKVESERHDLPSAASV